MPKVILIDAENREVREVEVADHTFKSYYPLVKTDMLQSGFVNDSWFVGNTLYVDEEGLLKNPNDFFKISGGYQAFAGNGLIAGFNSHTGENLDSQLTVEEVRKHVRFGSIL